MNAFLDWFYAFFTTVIDGFWKIISGIFNGIVQIFNVADYVKQVNLYKGGFDVLSWILFFISIILFLGVELFRRVFLNF